MPRTLRGIFYLFLKKCFEKFGELKKTPYLCTRLQEQGRLAQLGRRFESVNAHKKKSDFKSDFFYVICAKPLTGQ